MEKPGAVTLDAGQAFEAVDRRFVWQCLNFYFTRAGFFYPKNYGKDATLTVFNTQRCAFKLGGRVLDRTLDRTVFWLSKLYRAVEVLLRFTLFIFGNLYLEQVCGIPIGGPISGVILEFCLGYLEEDADKSLWQRFRAGTTLQRRRDCYIAVMRYVEDLLAISFLLCDDCLIDFALQTYSKQVAFEVSTESKPAVGAAFVKFLDVWVWISEKDLSFCLHQPNNVSVWTGDPGARKNAGCLSNMAPSG
jgi:hypothetical protein